MPSLNSDADLDTIVQDLHFLCLYGRGPIKLKAEVDNWATMLAQADPEAVTPRYVKRMVCHLICLANANATFRRAVPPLYYRGPVQLDVEDIGGYFIARHLVASLINSLPLQDDERLELAKHALAVDDRHLRALEQLLPAA